MKQHHICVISLALPIEIDPRTGRHVEVLSQHFDVTFVGFGAPSPTWQVAYKPIDVSSGRLRRLFEMLLLIIGRLIPYAYEVYFWTRPRYRQSLAAAVEARPDAYHAADWATLAVAARAAQVTGAKVVFDIDEYWALFDESKRLWLWFFAPLIRYTLKKYEKHVDASITVSRPFAERYEKEHGWKPIIATNAPYYVESPDHETDPDHIILIHHGTALRDRKLETLIEMAVLLDQRYTLHLMIAADRSDYLPDLRQLAERVAPNRVIFREPVPYSHVVQTIADADIQVAFMAPTTYTWLMTLPNKIFESMMAGLAVLVAPSPAMADVVRTANAGWVADGFTAADLARIFNASLSTTSAKNAGIARAAAKFTNVETEIGQILNLYRHLLEGK